MITRDAFQPLIPISNVQTQLEMPMVDTYFQIQTFEAHKQLSSKELHSLQFNRDLIKKWHKQQILNSLNANSQQKAEQKSNKQLKNEMHQENVTKFPIFKHNSKIKVLYFLTSLIFYQKDNHHKCPQSYQAWTSNCDVGIRRYQMDNREQQKKDQLLYTKEQLKTYNAAKNKEALGISAPKNLSFAF